MISVTAPGLVESYQYDGDGNKISQTVNGVTTNYLVDTNNLTGYAQVIEEIQGSTVTKAYTYGTSRISQDVLVGGNYVRSYYGYDGQGSVRFLMDTTGNVTDQYTYTSFGENLFATGTTSNDFQYDGEQVDGGSGFYYLRARWMNPGVGRFGTMDEFEGNQADPPSLHRYLFVVDNPVNMIDPTGFSNFVIGTIAHSLIEADYLEQAGIRPYSTVLITGEQGIFLDTNLSTISGILYGRGMSWLSGGLRRPDIVDANSREVYEIKSGDTPAGLIAGRAQMALYLTLLNKQQALYGKPLPNASGGISFFWKAGVGFPKEIYRITVLGLPVYVFPPQNGVILYRTGELDNNTKTVMAKEMVDVTAVLTALSFTLVLAY